MVLEAHTMKLWFHDERWMVAFPVFRGFQTY